MNSMQRINTIVNIEMRRFEESPNRIYAQNIVNLLKLKKKDDYIRANKDHRAYISNLFRNRINTEDKMLAVQKSFFRFISEDNPRIENKIFYMSREEMCNLYYIAARIALIYKVNLFYEFECY